MINAGICENTTVLRPGMTEVWGGPERHWYAVQTRVRTEKRVAERLEHYGLRTYAPAFIETHEWSDRRKRIEVAAFPGYIFLNATIDLTVRRQVIQAPGVVEIVGRQGQPTAIPEQEMENLQTMFATGLRCRPHAYLSAGKRVRVRGGALDGLEGVLVAVHSERSLVVTVNLIQRSLAVRIDGYEVEAA
jgi:transcription antitermination factor NusG